MANLVDSRQLWLPLRDRRFLGGLWMTSRVRGFFDWASNQKTNREEILQAPRRIRDRSGSMMSRHTGMQHVLGCFPHASTTDRSADCCDTGPYLGLALWLGPSSNYPPTPCGPNPMAHNYGKGGLRDDLKPTPVVR